MPLPPIMGINNTLAGGLAQAASAAVVSALSSLARPRSRGSSPQSTRAPQTTGTNSSSTTSGATSTGQNSARRSGTIGGTTTRPQPMGRERLAGLMSSASPQGSVRGFTVRITSGCLKK